MTDRRDVELAIATGRPAMLNGVRLVEVDLSGLDLAEADLSYADLSGARLVDAVLRNAKLWAAVARGTQFTRADLRGADLTAADLGRADLRYSRLAGATLTGTNLTGASLEGAELPQSGLAGALTDVPEPGTPSGDRMGSAGGPTVVVLDDADNGRRLTVPVGASVRIGLPEGTTGYTWRLADAESAGIGRSVVLLATRREPPTSSLAGAFGQRLFEVSARRQGHAELTFALAQPWDPVAEPEQRFTVTIEVV